MAIGLKVEVVSQEDILHFIFPLDKYKRQVLADTYCGSSALHAIDPLCSML